jgi:hypothetical protein
MRALGEAGAAAYRELEFRRKMAVVLLTGTQLPCFTAKVLKLTHLRSLQ